MGGWVLFFGLCCIAGIAVLIADFDRRKHEEIYKQRMRRSMLYYDIYSLVAEARKHEIDRVQVERRRVIIFAVCPPGKIGEFVLTDHGHRPMNAQRTWAMVQALADDLPVLQNSKCYRLRRYPMIRPNGQKDYGYQFIIRSKYKTQLMYARQRVRLD